MPDKYVGGFLRDEASGALINKTVPVVETAQRAGRAFSASTSRLTLAAAGNFRATIQNPTGSGKNVFVYKLTGFATAIAWARLRVNPTTGLPATLRTNVNDFVGHPNTGVAVMRADTDLATALGGGSDSGIDIGIPNGTRWMIETLKVIPPGITLGINAPVAGASDAVITAYWFEENV